MAFKFKGDERRYKREYYRKNLSAKPGWTKERRATPSAAGSPSTAEIYWAAGFIEGEGCFGCFKRPSDKYVNVSVVAANCDLEPLRKLQSLFGGNIHKKSMGPRNRRQPYAWGVYGARALGVMQTLYALMSPRRQEKIESILATF